MTEVRDMKKGRLYTPQNLHFAGTPCTLSYGLAPVEGLEPPQGAKRRIVGTTSHTSTPEAPIPADTASIALTIRFGIAFGNFLVSTKIKTSGLTHINTFSFSCSKRMSALFFRLSGRYTKCRSRPMREQCRFGLPKARGARMGGGVPSLAQKKHLL